MTGCKGVLTIYLLALLLLAGCTTPTAVTPDPRPVLETIVASTLQAASAATADAVPSPSPSPTATQIPIRLDVLEAELERALAERQFYSLQSMMAGTFTISIWQSETIALQPEQAVDRMRSSLLNSKATISFSTELPGGIEAPQSPDLIVRRVILSKGWGMDGLGEALITIAQRAGEQLAWHSVLFAPSGFQPSPPAELTGIIYVASANLRAGPGPLHPLVGPYAMGTPMTISYAAPGRTWGKAVAPDGKEGWILLSLLDFKTSTDDLPLYPGIPPDSIPIIGWVEGGSGQPIDKAYVALWKKEDDVTRPLGITGKDGMFYIYLPSDSSGNWTAGVISVDCASTVMDADCTRQKEFVQLTQAIVAPISSPVVFVYNNILSATPAPVAQGCPASEAGKIPLSNTQDGYCLLYPEGFTILQPETNLLEFIGPDRNQASGPSTARVSIQRKSLPGGSTLETVAAALWSEADPGYIQNSITLAGEAALDASNLTIDEAAWHVRKIVVIHQGSYYIITFNPFDQDDEFAMVMLDQQKAWDTIISSFRFLP